MQEMARNFRFVMAEQTELKREVRLIRSEMRERRDTYTFDQCPSIHEIQQFEIRLRSSNALVDALVSYYPES